jgi:hypothetical protein
LPYLIYNWKNFSNFLIKRLLRGLYISYLFYGGIFSMGASSVTGISGPGAVRGMTGPGNNRNFWVSQVSPHILAAGQFSGSTAGGGAGAQVTITAVNTAGQITAISATPAAAGAAVTTVTNGQVLFSVGTGTGGIVSATVVGGVVTTLSLVACGVSGYSAAAANLTIITTAQRIPCALDLSPANYAVAIQPMSTTVGASGVASSVVLLDNVGLATAWTGTLANILVYGTTLNNFMWQVSSTGFGVEAAASPNAATGWPDDRESIVNAQASAALLPYG